MQKTKVRLKVLLPTGVALSPSETVTLASIYREDAKVISNNEDEIRKAIRATQKTLSIKDSIQEAQAAKSAAAGYYKRTIDPIKKREWARRIVVADTTVKSLRDVNKRLEETRERLTMISGDIHLQLLEAEAKASEMEAYASAGKGLRLVGEKLIQARSRANKLHLEYTNLEVTMEKAENTLGLTPEQILLEAENIVKAGSEKE